MREFAKVSPLQWTSDIGRKVKNLGTESRLVSLYLLTNPSAHMTGIYYLPYILIAHETNLSINQVITAINKLIEIGYCSYDKEFEFWVSHLDFRHLSAIDQLVF